MKQILFLTKLFFFYFAVQKSFEPKMFFNKLLKTEDITGLPSIQYCCSTHLVLLKQLQSNHTSHQSGVNARDFHHFCIITRTNTSPLMRYINWLLKTGSGSLCWTIVTLWCSNWGYKDTKKIWQLKWQEWSRLTQLITVDEFKRPTPYEEHTASHDFTQMHKTKPLFSHPDMEKYLKITFLQVSYFFQIPCIQ